MRIMTNRAGDGSGLFMRSDLGKVGFLMAIEAELRPLLRQQLGLV